ncbi:MAG: hypothetical protein EU551_00800 [Promethearchaeota archaeon]|nr:MAG: hypothetical protein EU551_00800 [Candidatus Lokiarchaeota archaeon]
MSDFRVINPKYKVSYDENIINNFKFKNIDIKFTCFLCRPPKSKNEGIYYRIIETNEGKCIQCISFWKRQWFPYHVHDYHPFYIYLDDKNLVKFIIIDDGHHYSKLINIDQKRTKSIVITFFLPDHGLTDQINHIGKQFKPKLIPLRSNQIINWWIIDNMAQLKLRTKLVDPYIAGLIPKEELEKDSLIYRLNHLSTFPIIPREKNNLRYSFRDEIFCPKCKNPSLITLDYVPVYYDQDNDSFYLKERMKCKNNHEFSFKYDFKSGKIIYE